MITCPFCNQKIKEEDFEEHLMSYHFLSYQLYYEIVSQSFSESLCWKCGGPRIPLTPFSKNYYLPCFNCFGSSSVVELLETFLKKFEGNKYLQYYLCDDSLPEKTFPHTIDDFLLLTKIT